MRSGGDESEAFALDHDHMSDLRAFLMLDGLGGICSCCASNLAHMHEAARKLCQLFCLLDFKCFL